MTSFTVVFGMRDSSFAFRLDRTKVFPARLARQTRRFEKPWAGDFNDMASTRAHGHGNSAGAECAPVLVFVGRRHCGATRRMESLVAWVKVTQKKRLRVVELDADRSPELAHHLGVRETPTLLVLERGAVVDRLEGRATGRQIDELIRPYLEVVRRSAA